MFEDFTVFILKKNSLDNGPDDEEVTVSLIKEEALDLLKELAAELGYNLIKCVED